MLESPVLSGRQQPGDYASFTHTGTWVDDRLCNSCGRASSRLAEPLLVEWDKGSNRVGDFSYCGYTVIATKCVRDFLIEHTFEFEYRYVEVVRPDNDANLEKRVPYPYTGPELFWIVPRIHIPLDPGRSGVRQRGRCDLCGMTDWSFARDGIVVDRSQWNHEKVFEIEQFVPAGAIVITEMGLSVLLSTQLSNIGFHECGMVTE
jgi:hypothetical protein